MFDSDTPRGWSVLVVRFTKPSKSYLLIVILIINMVQNRNMTYSGCAFETTPMTIQQEQENTGRGGMKIDIEWNSQVDTKNLGTPSRRRTQSDVVSKSKY